MAAEAVEAAEAAEEEMAPTVPQICTFHPMILVLLAIFGTAPVGPSTLGL